MGTCAERTDGARIQRKDACLRTRYVRIDESRCDQVHPGDAQRAPMSTLHASEVDHRRRERRGRFSGFVWPGVQIVRWRQTWITEKEVQQQSLRQQPRCPLVDPGRGCSFIRHVAQGPYLTALATLYSTQIYQAQG